MMKGSCRVRNQYRNLGQRPKTNPYWKHKGATPWADNKDSDTAAAAPISTQQSGDTRKQHRRPNLPTKSPGHINKEAQSGRERPPAAAPTKRAECSGEGEDRRVAQGGISDVTSEEWEDGVFGWEQKKQPSVNGKDPQKKFARVGGRQGSSKCHARKGGATAIGGNTE